MKRVSASSVGTNDLRWFSVGAATVLIFRTSQADLGLCICDGNFQG